jgi:putative zinc finger/helix-turn-helix YgiT family protein
MITKEVEFKVYIPNLEGDAVTEEVPIQVTVSVDPRTGEEYLTPESIQLIEDTRVRYMGLLSPQEIKDMRSSLKLSQQQMSELLQAGEKSFTRWESGRSRPSRMVNVLLRLIYEGKVFISDLVAQRMQGINWREKVRFQPKLKPAILVSQIAMQYGYLGPLTINSQPVITQPENVGLGTGFKKRDSPLAHQINCELCCN